MEVDSFIKLAGQFGVPVAIMCMMLAFAAVCVREVWKFIKPLLLAVFKKHIAVMDGVITKMGGVEASNAKSLDAHAVTHDKLDDLKVDVRAVADKITGAIK
jgi:hypothetical protein